MSESKKVYTIYNNRKDMFKLSQINMHETNDANYSRD
jgi:hypothetical protein